MGSTAYGSLHRSAGVVVEDEGHLPLGNGFFGQGHPILDPSRQLLAALGYRRPLIVFPLLGPCSYDDGLDHALKLGHGHAPAYVIGKSDAFFPLLQVHVVG